jgi:hypothetical protein
MIEEMVRETNAEETSEDFHRHHEMIVGTTAIETLEEKIAESL